MVSAIDATKPVDGVPASKADMRANFANAKAEIEALQASIVGLAPQLQGGMRNRLINGACRIMQRSLTTTPPANAITFNHDRWYSRISAGGKTYSYQNPGSALAGFLTAPQILSSGGAYAVPVGEINLWGQAIEGPNVEDIKLGTTYAKSFTLSFWCRGVTGTYAVAFTNGTTSGVAPTRCYIATYTLSATYAWQYIVITVPGDVGGTWSTAENTVGLRVLFNIGCGTNYATTPNVWTTGEFYTATGTRSVTDGTNLHGIVGIQLEVGSAASPFEYLARQNDLILCQRYYQLYKGAAGGTASGAGITAVSGALLPVVMASIPTVSGTGVDLDGVTINASIGSVNAIGASAASMSASSVAAGLFTGSAKANLSAEIT